jgi:hypothetical protein
LARAKTTSARHLRQLRLAMGRAQLALGKLPEAAREIDLAAAQVATLPQPDESLLLAQTRSAQAELAMAQGNRRQAAQFLAEADAALRGQAPVGAAVSQPLQRLRERLAAR